MTFAKAVETAMCEPKGRKVKRSGWVRSALVVEGDKDRLYWKHGSRYNREKHPGTRLTVDDVMATDWIVA